MIDIFILRHGEAEFLMNDEARNLTQKGIFQCENAANALKKSVDAIDYTLVSPYLRTQQTLQTVKRIFPALGEIETTEMITPNGSPKVVADYLDVLIEQGNTRILVISHMPFVGYLTGTLCQRAPIGFMTASLIQVKFDSNNQNGDYHWIYSPQ